VIRVQYQDVSSGSRHGAGLYGTAEPCPRGVTIHLVRGLTSGQRKAAIRRLRQEASRGCGPALPLPGLVVALALDRVRVAFTTTAAAVRLHPAATLLPAGLAVGGMVLLVLTSAGVRPQLEAAAGSAVGGHADAANVGRAALAVRLGQSPQGGGALFDSAVGARGGFGRGGFGPGGRGLVSGQRRLTTGRARPRAARVCFGAMPGVAAPRSRPGGRLACRSAKPSGRHRRARRARRDSRP
jgi:hypothetical protein